MIMAEVYGGKANLERQNVKAQALKAATEEQLQAEFEDGIKRGLGQCTEAELKAELDRRRKVK